MTKFNSQFQNDIAGAANSMVTQMLCAERGIDFNNLMQVAQQNHMQQILQHEQQRQMGALVKRHYQGESFVGKIAGMFGGQETNLLMPVPAPQIGQAMPFVQQPMLQQPPAPGYTPVPQGLDHMQASQYLVSQPQIPQQPAMPAQDPQVVDLQNQMNEIKSMLVSLVNPQPVAYTEPQFQQPAPQGYVPAEANS